MGLVLRTLCSVFAATAGHACSRSRIWVVRCIRVGGLYATVASSAVSFVVRAAFGRVVLCTAHQDKERQRGVSSWVVRTLRERLHCTVARARDRKVCLHPLAVTLVGVSCRCLVQSVYDWALGASCRKLQHAQRQELRQPRQPRAREAACCVGTRHQRQQQRLVQPRQRAPEHMRGHQKPRMTSPEAPHIRSTESRACWAHKHTLPTCHPVIGVNRQHLCCTVRCTRTCTEYVLVRNTYLYGIRAFLAYCAKNTAWQLACGWGSLSSEPVVPGCP